MATTQIGLHQIEFGGEFEQRTKRSYSLSGRTIARYVNDDGALYSPGAEGVSNDAPEDAVTIFGQL